MLAGLQDCVPRGSCCASSVHACEHFAAATANWRSPDLDQGDCCYRYLKLLLCVCVCMCVCVCVCGGWCVLSSPFHAFVWVEIAVPVPGPAMTADTANAEDLVFHVGAPTGAADPMLAGAGGNAGELSGVIAATVCWGLGDDWHALAPPAAALVCLLL